MFPKIAELEFEADNIPESPPPIGKTFLYDYDKGDFVYQNGGLIALYGKDALKEWIKKIIKTEAGRFKIYEGTDYGVGIETMIGKLPREVINGELQRVVTESLTDHPHIDDIEDWEFDQSGTRMNVSFTVVTPDESFSQEVNV